MRVRPDITKKATYVEMEYTPILDVDELRCQKALSPEGVALTAQFRTLENHIIDYQYGNTVKERKTSTSENARRQFLLATLKVARKMAREFFATEKERREKIASIQQKQIEILQKLRTANSTAIVARKKATKQTRKADEEALSSGNFWNCSEQRLKDFFSVPFSKRKLVDVSEKYRAALFIEVKYDGCGLQPTGKSYLCGIDDNNEEWGFRVPYRFSYQSKVVDAMSSIWNVPVEVVQQSIRQGELLFHREEIPSDTDMKMDPVDEWQPAPSHTITSKGLKHNGKYFFSENKITVSHPTHQLLKLPAGSWRVYIHTLGRD